MVSTEEGSQGRKDSTTQDQCLSPSWMSLGLLVTRPVTSLCCWYQLELSFNFCSSQVHKHYLETKSSLGSVNYSSSDQGCPLNHKLPPTHPHSNQACFLNAFMRIKACHTMFFIGPKGWSTVIQFPHNGLGFP